MPHGDARRQQALERLRDLRNERPDVERLRLDRLAAAEAEQFADQVPAAVTGVDQRAQVLARRFLVRLQRHADQLRAGHHDGEDVVEVVRETAGELADRFHLLRLAQLLFQLLPAAALPHFFQRAPHRGAQPLQLVLEHVVRHARPKRRRRALVADGAGHQHERHVAAGAVQQLGGLQAVKARHRIIRQHDVPAAALQRRDVRCAVLHQDELGIPEVPPQGDAHQLGVGRIVLEVEDPDPAGRHARRGAHATRSADATGSATVKVAPRPGSDSAHTLPPCRATTRRTVARPMPVPSNSSRGCSRWNTPNSLST